MKTIYVSDFSGADDRERIAAALDAAKRKIEKKIVMWDGLRLRDSQKDVRIYYN